MTVWDVLEKYKGTVSTHTDYKNAADAQYLREIDSAGRIAHHMIAAFKDSIRRTYITLDEIDLSTVIREADAATRKDK